MDHQIFCDGIGRITIIGGVVRLDLMTYSPTEMDATGQPRAVFSQRIAMGADGFLRSSEKILEAVQMLTRGAQRSGEAPPQPQRPPAQSGTVPPAPPAPQPQTPPPVSPPKILFP